MDESIVGDARDYTVLQYYHHTSTTTGKNKAKINGSANINDSVLDDCNRVAMVGINSGCGGPT